MNMLNDTSEMQSVKPRLWEMEPTPFFLQQMNWRKNDRNETHRFKETERANEYNVWALFGYRFEQPTVKYKIF